MNTTSMADDLMFMVVQKAPIPFSFITYESKENELEWHGGDIATVFGCSPSKTRGLLAAAVELNDNLHFQVDRDVLEETATEGKGVVNADLRKIRVQISAS